MSMCEQSGLWNVETVTTGLTIEVEHHRQFSISCWLMLHSSASHHFSVRSTEMSCQKFIFSNIEISNGRYWTLAKIYKDVLFFWQDVHSFDFEKLHFLLWLISVPPLQLHEIHHYLGPLTPTIDIANMMVWKMHLLSSMAMLLCWVSMFSISGVPNMR